MNKEAYLYSENDPDIYVKISNGTAETSGSLYVSNSEPRLHLVNTEISKDNLPSDPKYYVQGFTDKDLNRFAGFEYSIKNDRSRLRLFASANFNRNEFDLISTPEDNRLEWNNKLIDSIYSSSNNYIQYTNGLLICWGSKPTNTIITFPIAFLSTPSISFGYSSFGEAHYTNSFVINGYNTTNTSFMIRSYKITTNEFVDQNCEYIAIGRWK